MRYDKFRGESLQEILMEIRKKYGTNVYILDKKEIKREGLFGLDIFSKKIYEVQVMIPEESTSTYGAKSYPNRIFDYNYKKPIPSMEQNEITADISSIRTSSPKEDLSKEKSKKDAPEEKPLNPSKIGDDLFDIDNLIQSLQKVKEESLKNFESQKRNINGISEKSETLDVKQSINMTNLTDEEIQALLKEDTVEKQKTEKIINVFNEELQSNEKLILKLREKLIQSEFSEEFTHKFFQILNKKLPLEKQRRPSEFYKFVIDELKSFIFYQPEIELKAGKPKAVFFVGPNGSGKTTSLAKIAARYLLYEKKNISIISLDDYRLAASDQLRVYANILEVPFYSPLNIEEFLEFFYRDDSELVFIDTSGLSLKDSERLTKIKSYIEKLDFKEVHLVLSCTMRYDLIERYTKFFQQLPFDKIILTGLDEVNFSGFFVDLADKYKRPLSFLMNGHSVPDDILLVDSEELIELMIK